MKEFTQAMKAALKAEPDTKIMVSKIKKDTCLLKANDDVQLNYIAQTFSNSMYKSIVLSDNLKSKKEIFENIGLNVEFSEDPFEEFNKQ
jgi:hypothetical protein